jgi:hypothetical protein
MVLDINSATKVLRHHIIRVLDNEIWVKVSVHDSFRGEEISRG